MRQMSKATTATRARFGINNSPVRREFSEVGSGATELGRDLCGFRAYFSQIGVQPQEKKPADRRRASSPSSEARQLLVDVLTRFELLDHVLEVLAVAFIRRLRQRQLRVLQRFRIVAAGGVAARETAV